MIRELVIGMSVLGVLASMFVTAAYHRFGDVTSPTPDALQSVKQAVDATRQQPLEPVVRVADGSAVLERADSNPADSLPDSAREDAQPNVVSYVPNPDSLDSSEPLAVPVVDANSDPRTNANQFQSELPSSPEPFVPDGNGAFEIDSLKSPQAETEIIDASTDFSTSSHLQNTAVHYESELPNVTRDDVTSEHGAKCTIRPNDSFWKISQRVYGDGSYFRALYEHNRHRFPNPDSLPVGKLVDTPSSLTQASNDTSLPGDSRLYIARPGESLFDVARLQLGQASRYVEILRLNPSFAADASTPLTAGRHLRIPAY